MRFATRFSALSLFAATALCAVPTFTSGQEKDKPLLKLESKLTNDDPKDTVRQDCRAKIHKVKLEAGKVYVIDMISADTMALDPYLRLEDPDGKEVAKDDDSGGELQARIRFECKRAGEYRVIATSFGDGQTGS